MYPTITQIRTFLSPISSKERLDGMTERTRRALEEFRRRFDPEGTRDISVFSVPGRTELSGNHTDHNKGCVLAAPVDLDILAVVSKRSDGKIRLYSEGVGLIETDSSFHEPDRESYGTSVSLINGICAEFHNRKITPGGFDAFMTSDVAPGSGLSSSAAFEVMIGTILNRLYADESFSPYLIARIGQISENRYFGKPCGLLDQLACSYGGVVFMDFKDTDHPVVEPIALDLEKLGYALCITATGGTHADLTDAYASLPSDMKQVAACFGKTCLREVDPEAFRKALPELYGKISHRALLRSFHFFAENERVLQQKEALLKGDFSTYLSLVRRSGESSFCYLQNVYLDKTPESQPLSVALALSASILENASPSGAWRIQGGGFAGTIQAFVPFSLLDTYREQMDRVFGAGACKKLSIRGTGAVCLYDKRKAL